MKKIFSNCKNTGHHLVPACFLAGPIEYFPDISLVWILCYNLKPEKTKGVEDV
jgi:hypothetical protein